MEELGKEEGIEKMIKALKGAFLEEEEMETFSKWKEFDRMRRKEGENIQMFAI